VSLAAAIDQVRHAADSLVESSALPLPVQGLEAVIAGVSAALPEGAWWVPGPRERSGAVLLDLPIDRLEGALDGAAPYRIAPVSTAPALRALHAVGLAHATGKHAAVHLGAGSVADGAFAEALNLAALLGAKAVFVVAEHPLDGDAPLGPQSAAGTTALAQAHGLEVFPANGNDAASVREAVTAAADIGGPAVVVATLAPDQPITSGDPQ